MKHVIFGVLLAALPACHKSSEDASASYGSVVASAGDDQVAVTNQAFVTLDGSLSSDPSGGSLQYLWEQTAGTPVTINNPTSSVAWFTAPATTGLLTFRLTAMGAPGTDADSVNVNVKTVHVTSSSDYWFAGYGIATPITLAANVDGAGSYAYEWTGIAPWAWARITGGTTNTTLVINGTPSLTDLQRMPDRAEAAMLSPRAQGRMQLKFRATDTVSGDFDEVCINFSLGPFPTAVGGNVVWGEPVLLNGAATLDGFVGVSSWTWTGFKPNGDPLTFYKPNRTLLSGATDQRFVYFVPDKVGNYEVHLVRTPGSEARVITITCGAYAGVGGLTSAADRDKGECAACHGNQIGWSSDKITPWRQTKHASAYSRLLDPSDPLYAPSQAKGRWQDAFDFGSDLSIDQRTVGWSAVTAPSATTNGWAENARAEGYVFRDTSWERLVLKHPKTAAMSNVQCESCHGPGSRHAGDSNAIRTSYDAELCGRCHGETLEIWQGSPHNYSKMPWHWDYPNCNGCHTTQGFLAEMRAQEGSDVHSVLAFGANPARPGTGREEWRLPNCQACHDPHGEGGGAQLRVSGSVKFRNDAVTDAGAAAVCYLCHQGHVDTRLGSEESDKRRAPHKTTAGEMLAGANGYQFGGWTYAASPHAIPSKFIAPGRTESRGCLSCHADVEPAAGASGHGAVGGHTFRIRQGGSGSWSGGTGTTIAGTKKFVASGANFSFLRLPTSVFPGDRLTIPTGLDAGTYTIESVDSTAQVTVKAAANFSGDAVTGWSISSVTKYNTAACTQCHPVAPDLRVLARGDYDGDGSLEAVQDEIAGLLAALKSAIDAKLASLRGAGTQLVPTTGMSECSMCHTLVDTLVTYKTGAGWPKTFPGPGVALSETELDWSTLPLTDRATWTTLYRAAYNYYFVVFDGSGGIHNTGYAVDLLQSSIKAVNPAAILGDPFEPYP